MVHLKRCSKAASPRRSCRGAKQLAMPLLALGIGLATAGRAPALTTDELLDEMQERAFDYFWNEANPANGLIKDRSTSGSPCSIASVGFGLSGICIGIEHGWVSRVDGRARVITTLETFWNGPQGSGVTGTMGHNGLFYHFLDMTTGLRTWSSELSTIDTALLLAGVLDVRQYFSTSDPLDIQVRTLADQIVNRVNWPFMYNGLGLRMGWKPETGGFGTWVGYNEAMILYILAFGSPTHPISSSSWFTWTSGYDWLPQYGQTYVNFAPLFGHQYSHCWVDFRSIQDLYMSTKGITYFENSRRATLAQRAYCIANPGGFVGYGANLWGLTASDDPFVGYIAHGAPPAENDNGTLTPTAPASSIVFAPDEVIPVLHNMYDNYPLLWGPYGFRDAFHPGISWYDTDYLGIDQGPILLMIENYRNQQIWGRMMQDPVIQLGLQRAGFGPATSIAELPGGAGEPILLSNAPNPFRGSTTINYGIAQDGPVAIDVFDVGGRKLTSLVEGDRSVGQHQVKFDASGLGKGVYFYRLSTLSGTVSGKMTVIE